MTHKHYKLTQHRWILTIIWHWKEEVNGSLLSVSETLLLYVALVGHLRKQDIVLEKSQLSHSQSLPSRPICKFQSVVMIFVDEVCSFDDSQWEESLTQYPLPLTYARELFLFPLYFLFFFFFIQSWVTHVTFTTYAQFYWTILIILADCT